MVWPDRAETQVEVAVVGAGLSGLTAAYHLRDRNVMVLEAGSQPGGGCLPGLYQEMPYPAGSAYFYYDPEDSESRAWFQDLSLEVEEALVASPASAMFDQGRWRPDCFSTAGIRDLPVTPGVRDPRCSYERSLEVLSAYRALAPGLLTKSSLLLGLGETRAQVEQTLSDLRQVGVDWVAIGQYLRPTRRHVKVVRYVDPAEFEELAGLARELGFSLVTAGPLVRSSYRAAEQQAEELLRRRACVAGPNAAGTSSQGF